MSIPVMVDPSAELQPAIIAAVRADSGVVAAFAPQGVKIYDAPPTMALKDRPRHYIIASFFQPLPLDGTDAAETEVTLDIFSLSDPPGKTICQRIGAAALAAALTVSDLPSHSVKTALPTQVQYLSDAGDGVTARGIVKFEIVTQPKS